ncbi:MAG TPA: PadR family transcriptional regulator [Candidatus Nesterenkonia stercoripullorum]|uniref:PadR family transcriptional regulator n=1 Tax=Candidatus Nesterenkonia stercoripullorum TaxID=2838701 RepID=A0A9D1USQ4_9MICC|nr:PadR family transcriptional regulator [Candidatus Nesterenkonia stercoripullorum]
MSQDIIYNAQLLKGVLPMLALALLDEQESYGYELVTRLRAAGLTSIAPGTVYPILSRLEREGQLTSRLQPSHSGPARKYYSPTGLGLDSLQEARNVWASLSHVVDATAMTSRDRAPAPELP